MRTMRAKGATSRTIGTLKLDVLVLRIGGEGSAPVASRPAFTEMTHKKTGRSKPTTDDKAARPFSMTSAEASSLSSDQVAAAQWRRQTWVRGLSPHHIA